MTAGDESGDVLVVRRFLPVPRERVFESWLDPESLARWMRPDGVTSSTVQVDARVGGTFRIAMNHVDGVFEHYGEYLRIEPPTLLAFTWVSDATHWEASVVTIEFLARGDGTELVLTHRRLPPDEIEPHRRGWTAALRELESSL